MANRRPLVVVAGQLQEIQSGDLIDPAFVPPATAGDVEKQISGTSTISANKCRTVVNRFTVPSGSRLVIEATGSLRVT